MESTKKWSGRKTFATVQTMVQETFGELHPDSWRRWDAWEEAKSIVKKETRGRKAKVSPAALHELILLAHQLASSGAPFSIDIFREIINQHLSLEMSRGWVHVFVVGCGSEVPKHNGHRWPRRVHASKDPTRARSLANEVGVALSRKGSWISIICQCVQHR
eukprot:2583349-Amphidinium_carterae.1